MKQLIITWARLTFNSLFDEIFGEPVDHPIIIRGLALVVDVGAFFLWTTLIYQVFGVRGFVGSGTLLLLDTLVLTTYFTLCSSRLFRGQSLGKSIFRIRVVDKDANYLGLGKSFIRAAPIALITNGYGIIYFLATEYEKFFFVGYAALTTILFGFLYFFIFKLNRQGIHDIIVESQVIPKKRVVTTKSSVNLVFVLPYIFVTSCYLIYIRLIWMS